MSLDGHHEGVDTLTGVPPLTTDKLSARVDDDGTLRLVGSYAPREPRKLLQPFFAIVHRAAIADKVKELRIDVTELTFMNSSTIRFLIDLVERIRATPEEQRYCLHFFTHPDVTWQQTSFSSLRMVAPDEVKVTVGPSDG